MNKCKYCGAELKRLMALALLQDFGATVVPGANYCPKSPDEKHDFLTLKEVETNGDDHETQ